MVAIRDVSDHLAVLRDLSGVVRVKQALRVCRRARHAGLLGGQLNDGPLGAQATEVFSLQLHGTSGDRIQVFFYDAWAQACDFLSNGLTLTITGPGVMVQPNDDEEGGGHPYVLQIAPPALLPGGPTPLELLKIVVESGTAQLILTDPTASRNTAAIANFRARLAGAGGSVGLNGKAPGPEAGQRRGRAEVYGYTPLRDIRLPEYRGREVNVYGMVVSFSHPKITKGSDYAATYFICDETKPDPESAVCCNVFRRDIDTFPRIRAVGDILRIHRIRVSEYQNRVQLVGGGGGGQTKNVAYLSISRKASAKPLPAAVIEAYRPPTVEAREGLEQHSGSEEEKRENDRQGVSLPPWRDECWEVHSTNESYTFDHQDEERIMDLWAWRIALLQTRHVLQEHLVAGPRNIAEVQARMQGRFIPHGQGEGIAPQGEVDLCGLLIAWGEGRLGLWDGTGTGTGQQTLCPVQVVNSLAETLRSAREGPAWADLLEKAQPGRDRSAFMSETADSPAVSELREALSRSGGRLQVRIPPEHRPRLAYLGLQPGRWIRLSKLAFADGEEPFVGLATSLNPLPHACLDMQRVAVRFLVAWYRWRWERSMPPCLEIFHKSTPVLHKCGQSVSYVIEALGSASNSTFALRTKIISHAPADPRNFCVLIPTLRAGGTMQLRKRPRQEQKGSWRFCFSLRLEDETGTLDAILLDEATRFLLGDDEIQPCDLSLAKNSALLQKIQEVIERYAGESRVVDVLVRSYVVRRGGREDGERVKRFRLVVPEEFYADP